MKLTYPTARREDRVVTVGGVSYTDAFQWLEQEMAEALDFQVEQDRLAQGWLKSSGSHRVAEKLLNDMPRVYIHTPIFRGGRWFRTRIPDEQDLQVIEVASTLNGPWRRIVDLNTMIQHESLWIEESKPSPDGKKLLFTWSGGGRERENIQVIDVDSGEKLLTSIRQLRPMVPSWLPDSSGFYYAANEPSELGGAFRVYKQTLGAEPVTVAEKVCPSHPFAWAKPAADRKHVFIIANHTNPRPDYIRVDSDAGQWREFLKDEPAFFRGDIIGDRYYAITNDGAPCGRLVSIPLATPRDRSTWKELIPGSDNVLATLLVVDGRLVVSDLVDTWARLRVFDINGVLAGEVQLPHRGALCTSTSAYPNVIDMIWPGEPGEVLFHLSAPTQSPALYKANVHTLETTLLTEDSIHVEADIFDISVKSPDSARVLYHVIAKKGTDLALPKPTIIFGYGGFAIATVPGWCGSFLAAWVKAGGLLVLAHLRGGAELGPEQWHSGRLKKKQNTFNDLYAIAGDLAARGISTSSDLGVYGLSNGGVLAAAAVVQRPDLFRAAISQVPLTDMLACARDPITRSIAAIDYGDPDDAEMAEVLLRWSPYQNVRDGLKYPAVLFDSGSNDPRCPPWHSRKMAARLQPANAGENPILMRIREGAGHGAVGASAQKSQDTDFLTFFAAELGLSLEHD